MVQWLGLQASTAGGMGLIPSWGTKIPQKKKLFLKKKNLILMTMIMIKILPFSRELLSSGFYSMHYTNIFPFYRLRTEV